VFRNESQEVLLSEQYRYDRSSRLLSAINGRAKVFNSYDAIGRIVETQQHHAWPNGASNGFTTTIAYDVDSNSTRTIHYPEGRTVVETVDYRGRMVGLDGETGVGGRWTFDAGNRRTGADLANFFKSVFSHDANDRLTNISHYHSAPPFPMPIVHYAVEYGYDVVGNRTSTRNLGREDHSQRYRYDDLNRLTMFRRGTMNTQNNNILPANGLVDSIKTNEEFWEFDDRGNWPDYWKQVGGPSADWYEEIRAHNGANEIGEVERYLSVTALPTVTPVFDENGNLTLDPLAPNVGTSVPDGQRNEYDPANRLTRVWRMNDAGDPNDDELLLEICYDALGRRVRSDEFIDTDGVALTDPQVTLHLYVGLTPIEEYAVTTNGAGGYNADLVREFVWGARFPEPVAMIDHTDIGDVASNGAPEVLHYLHDVLGSVVALTNINGQVVERYDYDPYGEHGNRILASRYGNPFLWTGQRRDATTGQYHFWARTYSPHLGRWLQRDPLGYVDGINLYEPGRSSMLDFNDPLGLDDTTGDDVDKELLRLECNRAKVGIILEGSSAAAGEVLEGVGNTLVAAVIIVVPGPDDAVIAVALGTKMGARAAALAGDLLKEKKVEEVGKLGKKKATQIDGGDLTKLDKDFEKVSEGAVITNPEPGVTVATHPDGTKFVKRPSTKDGRATIEIRDPDGTKTKVRYGDKPDTPKCDEDCS